MCDQGCQQQKSCQMARGVVSEVTLFQIALAAIQAQNCGTGPKVAQIHNFVATLCLTHFEHGQLCAILLCENAWSYQSIHEIQWDKNASDCVQCILCTLDYIHHLVGKIYLKRNSDILV